MRLCLCAFFSPAHPLRRHHDHDDFHLVKHTTTCSYRVTSKDLLPLPHFCSQPLRGMQALRNSPRRRQFNLHSRSREVIFFLFVARTPFYAFFSKATGHSIARPRGIASYDRPASFCHEGSVLQEAYNPRQPTKSLQRIKRVSAGLGRSTSRGLSLEYAPLTDSLVGDGFRFRGLMF